MRCNCRAPRNVRTDAAMPWVAVECRYEPQESYPRRVHRMIGVFDSGLGGLSVLSAIEQRIPQADLIYLADTAHVPYGDKDNAFIEHRVLSIGRHLVARGCSQIVVACNTATAAAVSALRAALPDIPVVGIEPGIKPAAAASPKRHIAVLTTASTARSARLARLIRAHAGSIRVDVVPCPGWATQVESLAIDDPAFAEAARRHLAPALDAGADRIVLGCTHYAFLAPLLEPIVAGRASLVDVADAVACQCLRKAGPAANGKGTLTLLATAQPARLDAALPRLGLARLAERLIAPAALAKDV